MPDPIYTTVPIPGTGKRERVVVNEDDTVSRPTQAVFADSSGLASETNLSALKTANHADLAALLAKLSSDPATQTTLAAVLAKLSSDPATQTTLAALVAANHTDLVAVAGKLDTVITKLQGVIDAIGLLPQA